MTICFIYTEDGVEVQDEQEFIPSTTMEEATEGVLHLWPTTTYAVAITPELDTHVVYDPMRVYCA